MDSIEGNNEKPPLSQTLAGELKKGWDDTSRLDNRLESMSLLKQRTMLFVNWALAGGVSELFEKSTCDSDGVIVSIPHKVPNIFRKLQDCGQYLIFRNYLVSKRSRLIGACTCKQHLLCAFCASRRGVKNSVAYKEKVDFLVAENPNLDLVFITFTVKNGSDLAERFQHLRTSMQSLLRHRNNEKLGHGKHVTEMFKLAGGVFAYEFKRGSGGGDWHPHIHMLALIQKDRKINIQALKTEWIDITQDSSVINIKYCTNDVPFLEVFAYALKFSEMEFSDRWFASQLLARERLISSFGSLRNVEVSVDDMDDILTTDEPFVDLLFRWCSERGYSRFDAVGSGIKISA